MNERVINWPMFHLILFWLAIALLFGCCSTTSVTKIEVRERIDTLVVKGDTIRIDTPSDTLRVVTVDTLIHSIHASIDTNVTGVRLWAAYQYPPDRWRIRIIERDTVVRWTVRDSLIERPYAVQEVPAWVYLSLAGMALALLLTWLKR